MDSSPSQMSLEASRNVVSSWYYDESCGFLVFQRRRRRASSAGGGRAAALEPTFNDQRGTEATNQPTDVAKSTPARAD